MKIRIKTLIIIFLIIVISFSVVFSISQVIILDSFIKLDEQNIEHNVEQVFNTLSGVLSQLETIACDWSSWDDTYDFIESRDEEYIESNLIDGTFITLDLNIMLYINSSGQIVFGKAFDLQNLEETRIPDGLSEHLSQDGILLVNDETEGGSTGVIELPEGLMLVSSQPILTSDDEGPARGTLIIGRYLDSEHVDALAEIVQLPIATSLFSDPRMPSDFKAALPSLSGDGSVHVRTLDEERIAGYALLTDVYGEPVLVLKVDGTRDVYVQGQSTFGYHMTSLLAVGLAFALVAILVMDRLVLSRLVRLSKDVSDVGTDEKRLFRVHVEGTDELSDLGGSINQMLAELEQSKKELEAHSEHLEELVNERTKELKETSRLYRGLFAMAGDPIIVIDTASSKILDANRSASRVLGYNKRELRRIHIRDITTPASLETMRVQAFELAPNRNAGFECEFEEREGNITPYELRARRIDYRGRPAILVVARDISKRKEWEQKMREASMLKSQFLASMSHELRTPLNAIIGYTELMLDENFGELNEKQGKCLHIQYTSAQHLLVLINDILDITKIESKKLEISESTFELADCVEDVVNQLRPLIEEKNHDLEVRLEKELPSLYSDRMRVCQVLFNLLNNAIKYTPSGGKIKVMAALEGNKIRISVSDNGVGIPKKSQKYIFDMFWQVDSTTKKEYSGAGLGLYISNQLVKLMGGRLWLESKPGKGSTFHFTIPVRKKKVQS